VVVVVVVVVVNCATKTVRTFLSVISTYGISRDASIRGISLTKYGEM